MKKGYIKKKTGKNKNNKKHKVSKKRLKSFPQTIGNPVANSGFKQSKKCPTAVKPQKKKFSTIKAGETIGNSVAKSKNQ